MLPLRRLPMKALQERTGECDVCALVDDNHEHKVTRYCGLCHAWMCRSCFDDGPKRAKAAVKRGLAKLKQGTLDWLTGKESDGV